LCGGKHDSLKKVIFYTQSKKHFSQTHLSIDEELDEAWVV
jgi:hypothetical protein